MEDEKDGVEVILGKKMNIKKRAVFKLSMDRNTMAQWILLLFLCEDFITQIMQSILGKVHLQAYAMGLVLSIIYFLTIIYIIQYQDKSWLTFLGMLAAVILIFLFTLWFHPEYEYFFTRENYGVADRILRPDRAVYAYLFFRLAGRKEVIRETIKKFAYIEFFYRAFFELLPALQRGYWEEYDSVGTMVKRNYGFSFGYAILVPTIIFLFFAIREKKKRYGILSALGMFMIFWQGSRGALLVVGIFVALIIVSDLIQDSANPKRWIKTLVPVALAFLLLLTYRDLISWFAQSFHIESRTLEMILNADISNDSGRSAIWDVVIQAIRQGGLFGYGAYGDRPIVYPYHYAGYSHNIFLELIINFGFVGVILCGVITVKSVNMIFGCGDKQWRDLFIIYFSISCQLLLSMSFWYVSSFWAAAAIVSNYKREHKVFRNIKSQE